MLVENTSTKMEIHETNKMDIYIEAGKKIHISNKQRLLYLTSKGRKKEGKPYKKNKYINTHTILKPIF